MKCASRLFAVAAIASGVAWSQARAAGYDGKWVVEFDTQVGSCEHSFAWPLDIVGGRVAGAEGATEASGFIAPDGLTSLNIKRGADIFRAQGSVKGAAGSGAWSSSTALCGGRWKLIRR